jgi:hypothetical protein
MAPIHKKAGENLLVSPTCLMFFCDETGHEQFADPVFPVFGLGGVAIMAGAIPHVIAAPWKKMKAEHFGGETLPLHASDLRHPSARQLAALTKFFKMQEFGRFAVTMTSAAKVPEHLASHDVISASIKKRWEELATRMNPIPTEVAFFFEASERTDELIQKYFSPIFVNIEQSAVPVYYGLMDKSSGDPVLEVADFIVHTAGRQAFNWSRGKLGFRRDFQDIFHANPLWSSFHAIEGVIV